MKHWTEIQGWLSEAEGGELQMLAAGKTVLEVGAWKGRSTICLASVANHVVTVDHFKGDGYTGAAFTLPDFVRTLADHDCRDRVTPIVGGQRDVLPLLCGHRFALIFYDADHTGEETQFALRWASRFPWARVAVHDYDPRQPQYTDAIAAVDDFARASGRALRVVDTLAVLEPTS